MNNIQTDDSGLWIQQGVSSQLGCSCSTLQVGHDWHQNKWSAASSVTSLMMQLDVEVHVDWSINRYQP